jgi:hypothetical protein
MADTHLLTALKRNYRRLLGKREVIEQEVELVSGLKNIIAATNDIAKRKKTMNQMLDVLDARIRAIEPSWDREGVRSLRPQKRRRKYGAVSGSAYEVLRDAVEPMTSRQIAKAVAARLGMENPSEQDLAGMGATIHQTMTLGMGRMILKVSEKPCRWALMPRDQAIAALSKAHASQASAEQRRALPSPRSMPARLDSQPNEVVEEPLSL